MGLKVYNLILFINILGLEQIFIFWSYSMQILLDDNIWTLEKSNLDLLPLNYTFSYFGAYTMRKAG